MRAVALGIAVALLTAGCLWTQGSSASTATATAPPTRLSVPSTPAPDQGGTLRWAIQEPSGLVPPEATDPDALVVVDALFESLTDYDGGLDVVPATAVRWVANDDATRWTFTLREGARFHDGTPVTARDFKRAWELVARTDGAGFHLRDVEGYDAYASGEADVLRGVVARDARTLRVWLSRPRADFPAVVAHPGLGPVQAEAWDADSALYRRRPIGNGPFRMAEEVAEGRFVRVTRFRGWRVHTATGPPERGDVEEVLFRITDPNTAYVAFQQGRVDVAVVPPGALAAAVDDYGLAFRDGDGGGVLRDPLPVLYYLGFRVDQPPFDDPAVRRAVSLAVDREELADSVLEGNGAVARSVVPPALDGYRGATCRTCVHSTSAAARLFADRDIDELTLWVNRDGGHDEVTALLQEQLGEAGVNLTVESLAFGDYLDALAAGEPGFFQFGWRAEYPVLDDMLFPLFHSSSVPEAGGGGVNYGRYADEGVDALLDEARRTMDPFERTALLQRAERLVLGRDQAIVPLLTYRRRLAVGERVSGLVVDPFGRANLESVTLEPAPLGP